MKYIAKSSYRIGKVFFVLFLYFSFIGAQAQNKYSEQINSIKDSYNQETLTELYTEFSERQTRLKNEAEAYALLNNIPLRFEKEDGTLLELQFIDEDGTPIYYTTYNDDAAISTRANYLNTGGGLGLDLNGDDLTAHVWDGGLARSTHQEYDGAGGNNRFSIGDGTSALHYHSAHVTGTIIASGVQAAAKGMAWQADAVGYDWNSDISEATTAAGNGMLVSNHSYGYVASSLPDDQFGQYWLDARDWDELMYNAPYYLMMVAAGNDGSDNSSNGSPLDGNSFYDKLSGHATAKNNLVVANGQDANINGDGSLNFVNINTGSSEGPTDDYRIKPDITGNGTGLYSTYESSDTAYNSISGTSMASPNVTGTLLVLQEHYNNLNGNFMRAATLKGLALHTADDAGSNGPDVVYGWGLLNAKFAAETITTDAAASGSAIINELSLSQGQTYQITVQSDGVNPLLASISWTDPAGALNSGTNSTTPALVNDLDIRLDNGASYTPWRLTGITTNGTGDNVVDPYERIDISGASGTYTLTVTHKGTLSSGSQNFSLIVTGIVVATTPVISFANTIGNTTEATNCSYTDFNVPVNIGLAPSANATVNFSINGSSTATSGLDFDLLDPSVTFPTGSIIPQSIGIRVYHDGFVEVPEMVIIDFTVNANGGDATADLNADTYTFTINDDDLVPVSTTIVTIYNEDFDDGSFDVTTNSSGDGSNAWGIGNTASSSSSFWNTTGNNSLFAFTNDDDCNCDKSNDLLTTDVFSLNGSYSSATLSFDHAFANVGAEIGDVLISTGGSFSSVLSLSNSSTDNSSGSYTTPWVNGNTIDLTPYIGQTSVQVQFRYNDGGAWLYGMAIDNITVTAITPTNVQTAINTNLTNDSQTLVTSGTIYTADSSSGDLMLNITNNQADDYGCLDISVSRAGIGAQSYNGSVAPDLVMDKTFEVLTENTTGGTGNTSITFYFTNNEISGWESAATNSRNNLVIGREIGGVITEVSNATIGAFGTNVTLTGNFSDARGTYIFGASNPVVDMNPCTNDPNVWFGGSWSRGTLDSTHLAVIENSYNTSTGNLDICSLVADNSLAINAGEFVKVDGDITVNGTLTIEHQGSLVQVNDNAQVINNGTINVIKTTPILPANMFSLLGSPMTGETRDVVFTNSNVLMNHNTLNFSPHLDVTDQDPSAENFADDNGDNWLFYTGSEAISPGVGYLVGPPTGGGAIDVTHSLGTLNNGVITYNALYHTDQNSSLNILSNPYASAIDAIQFIGDNTLVDAVYFWEHITAPTSTYPGYRSENWDMGDISMHNAIGGTSAPSDLTNTPPTQYIASGQGFAIKASAAGAVTFNNSMRVTGNNDGYRREVMAIDKLYLTIENATYHLQSSALIGFTDQATNGYDATYDTKRLATPVSIYSIVDEKELAIQGRSVFNTDHIIPLGFRTMVEEVQIYTISLGSLEGLLITDATVYLQDNLLNTVTNLSEEDYTFTSNESNQKDRFVLVFTEDVLGDNELSIEEIAIYPNPTSGLLNIVSPLAPITSIDIYDVRGRKVLVKAIDQQGNYQLDISKLGTAMYFVSINTPSGSVTKRIIKK